MLNVTFAVESLKFVSKWSFSYFQSNLVARFVIIATVKVKLLPDLYTWAIVLIIIKHFEEILVKLK